MLEITARERIRPSDLTLTQTSVGCCPAVTHNLVSRRESTSCVSVKQPCEAYLEVLDHWRLVFNRFSTFVLPGKKEDPIK